MVIKDWCHVPQATYPKLSQPHFEGSVRSPLTLPKMGLGSPLGLPKTQNAIAGVKTPCIEVFFIPFDYDDRHESEGSNDYNFKLECDLEEGEKKKRHKK